MVSFLTKSLHLAGFAFLFFFQFSAALCSPALASCQCRPSCTISWQPRQCVWVDAMNWTQQWHPLTMWGYPPICEANCWQFFDLENQFSVKDVSLKAKNRYFPLPQSHHYCNTTVLTCFLYGNPVDVGVFCWRRGRGIKVCDRSLAALFQIRHKIFIS